MASQSNKDSALDKNMSDIVNCVVTGNAKALNKYLVNNPSAITRSTNFSFTSPKQITRSNKTFIPCKDVSLLHIAAYYDNIEVFILLILKGAFFRIKSAASYLPLHYACVGNAKEVAAYILENDPDEAKLDLDVPLHFVNLAVFSNSPDILQMLFDHGTSLQTMRVVEGRPFDQALRSRNYDCLYILLKHQCATDVAVASMTPLMLAIVSGMSEAIGPLLARGIDPKIVNIKGQSALACACMMVQVDTVKLLCSRMNDIEIPCIEGESQRPSILRYAIHSKNIDILRTVLEKGCDVNRFDNQNELPAHSLLGIEDTNLAVEMLGMLIDAGMSVNARANKDSLRFLEYIVLKFTIQDCSQLIEYLLSHGADPRLLMGDGKSLIRKVSNFKESTKMLEQKYYSIFKKYYPSDME